MSQDALLKAFENHWQAMTEINMKWWPLVCRELHGGGTLSQETHDGMEAAMLKATHGFCSDPVTFLDDLKAALTRTAPSSPQDVEGLKREMRAECDPYSEGWNDAMDALIRRGWRLPGDKQPGQVDVDSLEAEIKHWEQERWEVYGEEIGPVDVPEFLISAGYAIVKAQSHITKPSNVSAEDARAVLLKMPDVDTDTWGYKGTVSRSFTPREYETITTLLRERAETPSVTGGGDE